VRFKNPLEGDVVIEDLVKGNIIINNRELDDLIIARGDGVPTYNLTVVVDDLDMAMTHVIRGDDHINNTPRQINIMRALGAELPKFAHVPMILGEDGKRLSKRHGAVGVMQYRDDGFLPEALLNYLVRLGWSHGDKELFTREELIELFRIEDVNRSASTFNPEKLLWINHETIKSMAGELLVKKSAWHYAQEGINIVEEPLAEKAIDLVKERTKTLLELVAQTKFFFNDVQNYDAAALKKWVKTATPGILTEVLIRLENIPEWDAEALHHVVQSTVDDLEVGFAKVAQPIRIAVTGGTQSPAIDETLLVLGRETTLQRVRAAIPAFSEAIEARQS
jgi:glutamyl-tRNA synthetase